VAPFCVEQTGFVIDQSSLDQFLPDRSHIIILYDVAKEFCQCEHIVNDWKESFNRVFRKLFGSCIWRARRYYTPHDAPLRVKMYCFLYIHKKYKFVSHRCRRYAKLWRAKRHTDTRITVIREYGTAAMLSTPLLTSQCTRSYLLTILAKDISLGHRLCRHGTRRMLNPGLRLFSRPGDMGVTFHRQIRASEALCPLRRD